MFERMLGRKDQPTPDEHAGPPLIDSVHTRARRLGRVVDAMLKDETVGEHQVRVVQEELTAACAAAESCRLVIDMSRVTLLASAGIGMLVTLHKRMRALDGEVAIYNLGEDIQHLMKITRMDRLFPVAADRDAAVRAVGG